MRKVMIVFMIVCLGVTLNISMSQVKAKDLDTIKEKTYEMFDKLYERDRLEQQDVLVIDTINDGSESIELDGIKYDKKVFYSSLFIENKNGKVKEKILKYKESNKQDNYDSLDELNFILNLYNSDQMNFNEIIDYIDKNDMIKEYKKFYKDLIPKEMIKDDRLIELQTVYEYETVYTGYIEDYDYLKTYSGVYHKQAEYFLDTDDITRIYTGYVRFVMAYPLNPYIENVHQISESFSYDPSDIIFSGIEEVDMTIIVDYLGYQKVIVVDSENSNKPFKITQLAHYNRNENNRVSLGGALVNESSANYVVDNGFVDDNYNDYFHNLLLTSENRNRVKYKKNVEYYFAQTSEITIGSAEAIIYEDDNGDMQIDNSSLRMGTFNFGGVLYDETGNEHRVRDVYPYLLWGNDIEDYTNHTAYERFIWDKGLLGLEVKDWQMLEGEELMDEYETAIFNDAFGDPIPQVIVGCSMGDYSCELDYYAPDVYVLSRDKSIYERNYSDIDWATRVIASDDYTSDELINIVEIDDNVVYDIPGTYSVIVQATDLSGNKKPYHFNVVVKEKISGC